MSNETQVAKELRINYCTAKTIIYNHRKKQHETVEQGKAKRCSYSLILPFLTECKPISSIVSMVGGKVENIQVYKNDTENQHQQIFFSLENVESYVEKFLFIKEIEKELIKRNVSYFVKFEGNKAIFLLSTQNESLINVDIISSQTIFKFIVKKKLNSIFSYFCFISSQFNFIFYQIYIKLHICISSKTFFNINYIGKSSCCSDFLYGTNKATKMMC